MQRKVGEERDGGLEAGQPPDPEVAAADEAAPEAMAELAAEAEHSSFAKPASAARPPGERPSPSAPQAEREDSNPGGEERAADAP